jgi:hypothetical protein
MVLLGNCQCQWGGLAVEWRVCACAQAQLGGCGLPGCGRVKGSLAPASAAMAG